MSDNRWSMKVQTLCDLSHPRRQGRVHSEQFQLQERLYPWFFQASVSNSARQDSQPKRATEPQMRSK